jgi:hypothetical protein
VLGAYVIVCEYFFKKFYSRGSDEYLHAWATEVDRMADEGWKVLDCCRQWQSPGFWTVVLVRPAHEFRSLEVEQDLQEGWEE